MNPISFSSLALVLILLVSACSRTPENLSTPSLEPQFGTAADDQATDVAVQKRLGHVYVAGHSGDKVFLRQYRRDGTLNWQRLNANPSGYAVRAMATDVDGSGNVYLAWGGEHENSFISKYNRNGTLIWRKPFPNLSNMAVDASGNLYLVGVDSVRKHTPAGALVWERRPNLSEGYIAGIAVAASGNVVAAGQHRSLVKYDNDGNNEELLGGFYNEENWVKGVAVGPNEEIYMAVLANDEEFTHYTVDVYKFDAQGRYKWRSGVVRPTPSLGRGGGGSDVAIDTKGNVYLTGSYACKRYYDDSGQVICDDYSPNVGDAFVRKLTSEGTTLWTRRFGTSRYDTGSAIGLFLNNELYVAGHTRGSLTEHNRGGLDAFLRKMNGSGTRIWTR